MTRLRAIHQFVPTLDPGDAVGNHAFQVQRVLRGLGLQSEVYSEHIHHTLVSRARKFREYRPDARTAAMYHLAVGSVLADLLLSRPEPLIVDHHNVTPGEFFKAWDPPIVHAVEWGRSQLGPLARRARLGLADSSFNRDELVAAGCARTAVVPILLDLSTFERDVDKDALRRLEDAKAAGGSDWLFVGRLVPNKAQHDLIKAFAVYRVLYDPAARLHIVGGVSSEPYAAALRSFTRGLGLDEAVRFTGGVPSGELAAYFRIADVYVCVSDHEGFCVPLLEAMFHEIPVVAYAATAVPETLGDAGILLPEKRPSVVATAVHRVLTDDALRDELVRRGKGRLADYALERTEAKLIEALSPLIEEGG